MNATFSNGQVVSGPLCLLGDLAGRIVGQDTPLDLGASHAGYQIPTPSNIKHLVGLRLCEAGVKNFLDLAARLGISHQYLSLILSTRERPAKHQRAIARICHRTPQELFGEFTSPELQRVYGRPEAGRITNQTERSQ